MSLVRHHEYVFGDSEAGLRLDQALSRVFTDYSRTALKGWIEAGQVKINDGPCRPRSIVKCGDIVNLHAILDAGADLIGEAVTFSVCHADDHMIIVDKPPGCVVHPGAGNSRGTLANGLIHQFPELAALPRAGLIHRLDKDTSGLLIVARQPGTYQRLVDSMAARDISRSYLALAVGTFIAGGTIEAPIGRDPANRIKMAVRDGGRESITHYRVAARYRAHTLLNVHLETGRTHQIRVHLAHIGHPIVGDRTYGGRGRLPPQPHPDLVDEMNAFGRQALHACAIRLTHPETGKPIEISSEPPADFAGLIAACQKDTDVNVTL